MRLSQNLNYFSSRYSGYFTLSKTLAESELSIAAVNVHDSYGNTNSEKYPSAIFFLLNSSVFFNKHFITSVASRFHPSNRRSLSSNTSRLQFFVWLNEFPVLLIIRTDAWPVSVAICRVLSIHLL